MFRFRPVVVTREALSWFVDERLSNTLQQLVRRVCRIIPGLVGNLCRGIAGFQVLGFFLVAGAALSRPQTAPPIALMDSSLPQTPTVLSILASTAYADEAGNDPNSPASATTGHVGASHQKGGNRFEVKEAHSAPCLSGLGKRRASESNISTQIDVKRSRAHLAHVDAAIKQVNPCDNPCGYPCDQLYMAVA